jgi:hypothetical protein
MVLAETYTSRQPQTLIIDLVDAAEKRLVWRGIEAGTLVQGAGRYVGPTVPDRGSMAVADGSIAALIGSITAGVG